MEDDLDELRLQGRDSEQTASESNTMKLSVGEEYVPHAKNILDRMIIQMLIDSKDENDEPLRMLSQSLFDPARKIERLNVDDSVILNIMYIKYSGVKKSLQSVL